MRTIEEQLNNIDWKNQEQVINFYESNLLYFENYQLINEQEKISEFIDIKLHYANSLFEKSHYDKLLKILEQIEQLLDKLGKDHWNFEQSERHLRFLKGMIYGNKKNFKDSYSIFKELVKEDPNHHYYRIWYNYIKLGLYNWIFNIVAILGGILIIGDLFFSLSDKLHYDLGIIGIIILLTSYLTRRGLNEYFKRRKTATNTR